MGLFAVLASKPAAVTVYKCHINVWCLPGILRRQFYCDVGLLLSTSDPDILAFDLVLPFGTDREGFEDLSPVIRNQRVAELIFGEPVDVRATRETTIRVRDQEYKLLAATGTQARSAQASSMWNIRLARPVGEPDSAYLRIRFRITSLGRTWSWKRAFPWRVTGARIDIRVSDIREAGTELDTPTKARIVPIRDLYVFVIAPWKFQSRSSSPTPRYTRLLEGRAWTEYLGTATDLRRTARLLIYYWRYAGNGPVDTANPYRIFLELSREYGPTLLASFVVVLIAVVLGIWFAPHLAASFTTFRPNIDWGQAAKIIGIPTGLMAALGFFSRTRRWMVGAITQLTNFSRQLERAVLRARR